MQRVVGMCVVVVVLVLLALTPAGAVTASDTELPFDAMGVRAQNSARTVWAPLIATIGILALGAAFIFGLQRLAGLTVRTAIGLGIIGIAITGVGLATLFPGLVTTVMLP